MSGASRKVKNPLLSAAGEGFPYENYGENALLVPVTPATPAVLRDDPELDNFVGQESINSQQSTSPATTTATNTAELTSVPLHSEEIKSAGSQPIKQGYFTSILSSLPNLSLSSITGDSSGCQTNQGSEIAATQIANSNVPFHDPRNSLRDASTVVTSNSQDPWRTNLLGSGEVNPGSTGNLSSPPQPTLPPTIPAQTDGRISYRLGNQRRLKYAPPPDLTLNAPKQYPTPTAQTFFSPQNVIVPPTILNPNDQTVLTQSSRSVETPISSNSPTVQPLATEQLSQNSSLQGSFRSSPITTGIPYSSGGTPRSVTPQNQNSYYESVPLSTRRGISISSSRPIPSQVLEPATPQNTPANVSFPGFELYTAQRDFLATPNTDKEVVVPTDTNQSSLQSQSAKDDTVDSSLNVRTESSIPGCADVTFRPISAVKVSEKLEHLLAEQEEHLSDLSTEIVTKSDGNITVENQTLGSTSEIKSNDVEEKINLPKLDALTIAPPQQKASEPLQSSIPQEADTASEKLNLPQSHAIKSNVSSFQPYYQTQPAFSGTNFFTGNTDQTLHLSTTSSANNLVSATFPDSSKTLQQSPSAFFESPTCTESFPPFQPEGSNPNAHVELIPTYSTNDLQKSQEIPTFNSHSVTAPLPVSQSLWATSQTPRSDITGTTCSSSIEPPPPLFYNPTQLQSEFRTYSPLAQRYAHPSEQLVGNQNQQYYGNLSNSEKSYNISSESDTIFLPTSSPMATAVPEPTGSATLNPVQMSVNPLIGRSPTDTVPSSFQNLAAGSTEKRMTYRAVYHHWFYRKEVEHKVLWLPFSMQDSLQLEEIHNSSEITPETIVATDGGRYDVDILRRQRTPVYWSGVSTEVRRCSWFFKGPTESRYVPYDESTAAKLEEEYKQACLTNNWNRRVDLNNGEYIILHSATVQVHYTTPSSPELAASWGNSAGSEDSAYLQGAASRPRVIKRGLDEFHIEDGEPEQVDHVLFLVHGIGSVCDLKFRSVEEVVDEFRSISLQLMQSHYRTASEQRIVNRIEVLPISWHTTLHSEDTGIDKKLQAITLESIPKLRHFTNDTLLDILFYTSPIYCQTIMQTVGSELNRLYALFKERNPGFDGGIYLGGHSLGSLILFDLLCHQKPLSDESTNEDDDEPNTEKEDEDSSSTLQVPPRVLKRRLSKKINYVMGAAGTGQPYIHYPQLNFHPRAFFALGSPIGMFVTVRGIDTLGEDFALPTCPAFFNVFHPFDPVAYRVEALINPDAHKYRPMLIPHHKGRKRMHLELKETMARVGADLKQKLLDSVRSTWNSFYQLTLFHKSDNHTLEREIDKVVEEQLQAPPTVPEQQNNDDGGADFKVGKLNGGRRIDYVLQEAPFEYINEYIFALTSHVCYWESEDTMLMILKEIYGSEGIQTDAQLPQQTLTIERVSPSPSSVLLPSTASKSDRGSSPVIGMDPTAPISEKPVGPPPRSGFVRKS